MKVRGQTQSVPLEVVPDPRLKETVKPADVAAHWDLVYKTHQDIDALHRAVNALRADRESLDKAATSTGHATAGLAGDVRKFEKELTPIEEELLQVNMKASEDNLRYPNKLNEQYDTFIATVDGDDSGPTDSQQQVYAELHRRLSEQLARWNTLVSKELPALNKQLSQAGLSPLNNGQGR